MFLFLYKSFQGLGMGPAVSLASAASLESGKYPSLHLVYFERSGLVQSA